VVLRPGEVMTDTERFFLVPCRRCGGEGAPYVAAPTWDEPLAERADPCPVCKGAAEEIIEEES